MMYLEKPTWNWFNLVTRYEKDITNYISALRQHFTGYLEIDFELDLSIKIIKKVLFPANFKPKNSFWSINDLL